MARPRGPLLGAAPEALGPKALIRLRPASRSAVRTRFSRAAEVRLRIEVRSAKGEHADDQPVDQQAATGKGLSREGPPSAGVSAEARRLHARLHDDAEEAELRAPQSRQGPADQWIRGHRLH